jgi:hypothetical protein
VELDFAGKIRHLQYAPYLDYRPLKPEEPGVPEILARPECSWITRELEQKAQGHAIAHVVISALPPVILGGLVVVPLGLLAKIMGQPVSTVKDAVDKLAVAARARKIIMEVERRLGFEPIDREFEKLGYDIESKDPKTGKLRFIEVKGRASGEQTLTVSRNEILYSLNTPDDFILGMVEFIDGDSHRVHYLHRPFHREPDFHVTSVNYSFPELLARAEAPRLTAIMWKGG